RSRADNSSSPQGVPALRRGAVRRPRRCGPGSLHGAPPALICEIKATHVSPARTLSRAPGHLPPLSCRLAARRTLWDALRRPVFFQEGFVDGGDPAGLGDHDRPDPRPARAGPLAVAPPP